MEELQTYHTQSEKTKEDLDTQSNYSLWSEYAESVNEESINEKDENGDPIMTRGLLKHILKTNKDKYYATPECNDILYLQHKRFRYFKNLDLFPELKCLYFEGNGLRSLFGLEQNTKLKSLFLSINVIKQIEGLSTLTNLCILNLSQNYIQKITGLEGLVNLENLNLSENCLGESKAFGQVEALKGLVECQSIHTLDLQQNNLTEETLITEIFAQMKHLAVFFCQKCDIVKNTSNFRRKMIYNCPNLSHLNEQPVFPDERRMALAFMEGDGGIQAERIERQLIKKETEAYQEKQRELFKNIVNGSV